MNEYEVAGIVGAVASSSLLVSAVVSQVSQFTYKWLDDAKEVGENKVLKLLRKFKGSPYKHQGYKDYWYKRGVDTGYTWRSSYDYSETKGGKRVKGDDEDIGYILFPILFLAFSPIALLCAFKLYTVTLPVAVTVGLLFAVRSLLRLSKKVKAHVVDPLAHLKKSID